MEKAFYHTYQSDNINDHKTAYNRAVAMMQSKEAKAFDISQESSANKAKYGTGRFNDGLLMARRLIEVGIPFVEVTLGGWDTHQDNFTAEDNLLRQLMAACRPITDLKERHAGQHAGHRHGRVRSHAEYQRPWRSARPRSLPACLVARHVRRGIKGGTVHGAPTKEGAVWSADKVSASTSWPPSAG
jgi:hypothetical protein